MKSWVLLLAVLFLSACLDEDGSNSSSVGELWLYDSTKSFPDYPPEAFIFKILGDTLHMLEKSRNILWKNPACHYPRQKVEIARSGDSIALVTTTDSIWDWPKLFYRNRYGELQSDSADASQFRFFFKRVPSFLDCGELFGRDFQLVLKKVSTESELYANQRCELQLEYSLNGAGYGYSGYEILISGGSIFLGSYLNYMEYYESAVPDRGTISLTIPLETLYDDLAENIRIRIDLGGRTPLGLDLFHGKEILYGIRPL